MSQAIVNSDGMGVIEDLVWTAATGNERQREDAGQALLGIGLVVALVGAIAWATAR